MVDNISSTLDGLGVRAGLLAASGVLRPKKPAKFDPNKAPDPLDFRSKPTNPNLQTIELPLISDVWNGAEPINYVSLAFFPFSFMTRPKKQRSDRVPDNSIVKSKSAPRHKSSTSTLTPAAPCSGFKLV